MADFFINGIIWVFALYGCIEIIKTIFYAFSKLNFKSDGIYLIIATKNQEEKIEGFIRSILFRLLYGKEDYISEVIVTDLDSTDKTMEILEKMQKDYDEIKVCNWKLCKELLEQK